MAALNIFIIMAVVASGLAASVGRYIRLLRLHSRAEEAWCDILLLLKRRTELIPGIAHTVQRYTTLERRLYRELVIAKQRTTRVEGVRRRAEAEAQLQASLSGLLDVIDHYPQLKAHDGLRQLRGELVDTEMRLRQAARVYNQAVDAFNRKRRLLPARLIAALAGLRRERERFGLRA